MASKIGFFDLPTEIRAMIYRSALISGNQAIYFSGGVADDSEIKETLDLLLVSKAFHTEAAPFFYGGHFLIFLTLSEIPSFVSMIGKKNSSYIKMLNVGNLWYSAEAENMGCDCEAANRLTAKRLADSCPNLELLDFHPLSSEELDSGAARFECWEDRAFNAVKAMTVAFPWLSYVSHDEVGEDSIRMTSVARMQVEGEDIPFDIDEEIKKREKVKGVKEGDVGEETA